MNRVSHHPAADRIGLAEAPDEAPRDRERDLFLEAFKGDTGLEPIALGDRSAGGFGLPARLLVLRAAGRFRGLADRVDLAFEGRDQFLERTRPGGEFLGSPALHFRR